MAEAKDHVAKSDILIDAAPDKVWDALTDSKKLETVMFGSKVKTDWKVGGSLEFSGEWEGKPFKDTGRILELDKNKTFRSTHVAGSDKTHTEHEVTYSLKPEGKGTRVHLTQTNNSTAESKAASEKNWAMMLKNLKKVAEG